MDNIEVSICCITYNHEKYISKCIEGFLNQQTTFNYEIIIHDDASTDKTQEILKRYEGDKRIKLLLQNENQHSKGKKILRSFLYPLVKGKYIALCEGDDYWSDNLKLQKQYESLEKNANCVLSVHRTNKIDQEGRNINSIVEPIINYNNNIIKGDDFIKNFFQLDDSYPFHTSSYFVRSYVLKEMPDFKFGVGDVPCMLWSAFLGDIYYSKDIDSCYRINVKGSFNDRISKYKELAIKKIYQKILGFVNYNKFTNYVYNELIIGYIEYDVLQYYYATGIIINGFDLKLIKRKLSFKKKIKARLKFTKFGNIFRRIKLYLNQRN